MKGNVHMSEQEYMDLVREYPFLIDEIYQTSRSCARQLYANGFPSVDEILEGAKRKHPEVSTEVWKKIEETCRQVKE